MKILDLLKIAGGLDDKTFIESIYMKEAELIRMVPNNVYPKRIPLDLEQLINDPTNHNIELHNQDIILVRENSQNSDPQYVTIHGKVNVPGKYTIQKKEESLENIITRAGGFSENAYINGLQMYRDSVQVVLQGYNVFVAGGDSVYVPEPPGVVKIEGQVNREGLIQFVKGKSLRYYIERAGGFSNNANKKNITVHYANGNVRQKKSFITSLLSISPPVKDGSTIIVYTKQPKPPFSAAQFLSATASAATSIITIWLIYQNNK
jgi:polysaccharide export outer membrane protein